MRLASHHTGATGEVHGHRCGRCRRCGHTFLQTPKRLVGAESPIQWADGRNEHEMVIHLPLEVNGEQSGAKLMVVGFPRSRELKFRVAILMTRSVCRLDYTDETHVNAVTEGYKIQPIVKGPHYHSWKVNRMLCRSTALPVRLLMAIPFDGKGRSFDAILRWFCSDNNIEGLATNHCIELPKLDRLFP
jgi:hypothetical protein